MTSVFSATLPVTPRTGVKSISLVLSPAQAVLDFSDYEFTNDANIYESKTGSRVTKHGGTLAASHPIVNQFMLMRWAECGWSSLIEIPVSKKERFLTSSCRIKWSQWRTNRQKPRHTWENPPGSPRATTWWSPGWPTASPRQGIRPLSILAGIIPSQRTTSSISRYQTVFHRHWEGAESSSCFVKPRFVPANVFDHSFLMHELGSKALPSFSSFIGELVISFPVEWGRGNHGSCCCSESLNECCLFCAHEYQWCDTSVCWRQHRWHQKQSLK